MSTLVDMKFNSFQQKMTLPDRLVERKLMGRENNIDKEKKKKEKYTNTEHGRNTQEIKYAKYAAKCAVLPTAKLLVLVSTPLRTVNCTLLFPVINVEKGKAGHARMGCSSPLPWP